MDWSCRHCGSETHDTSEHPHGTPLDGTFAAFGAGLGMAPGGVHARAGFEASAADSQPTVDGGPNETWGGGVGACPSTDDDLEDQCRL